MGYFSNYYTIFKKCPTTHPYFKCIYMASFSKYRHKHTHTHIHTDTHTDARTHRHTQTHAYANKSYNTVCENILLNIVSLSRQRPVNFNTANHSTKFLTM